MEKTSKLHYTKVIISAALMVGASMGLCFYSAGVFYEPLAAGLGISIGEASLSTTFMLGFMAAAALILPGLLRRFRFETLLLIGTVLAAGSVLCISFCFNRWFVYVFASLLGIGAGLIGMVPATTMINNWFESKKFKTTAIVLAASALSAALFSPLMSAAVTALGWRMGLVVQAVLIVILMFPVIYWHCPLHPAAVGQVAYGTEETPSPRKKTPLPVLGCFALIAILSAALIGLPLHFSTLAASLGDTAMTGAVALSWCMIGNLVFKLLGGWLSDKLKPILATGLLDLVTLIATAGILICILVASGTALLPLAFFFGSAFALSELSLPLLVSNHVAAKRYSSVYALLNFLSTLTTAVSISVVGFLYDTFDSYAWIYFIALAEEVIIVLVVWYLIHSEKADDLITNANTRSFIEKLRRDREHRKEVRAQKAEERREEEARKKAAPAAAENFKNAQAAASSSAGSPASDQVFTKQMALIDEEPGPVPDFEETPAAPETDSMEKPASPDVTAPAETESAAPAAAPKSSAPAEKTEDSAPAAAETPAADEPAEKAEPAKTEPKEGKAFRAAPDPKADSTADFSSPDSADKN